MPDDGHVEEPSTPVSDAAAGMSGFVRVGAGSSRSIPAQMYVCGYGQAQAPKILAASADSTCLYTISQQEVSKWRVKTGELLETIPLASTQALLSGNDEHLFLGGGLLSDSGDVETLGPACIRVVRADKHLEPAFLIPIGGICGAYSKTFSLMADAPTSSSPDLKDASSNPRDAGEERRSRSSYAPMRITAMVLHHTCIYAAAQCEPIEPEALVPGASPPGPIRRVRSFAVFGWEYRGAIDGAGEDAGKPHRLKPSSGRGAQPPESLQRDEGVSPDWASQTLPWLGEAWAMQAPPSWLGGVDPRQMSFHVLALAKDTDLLCGAASYTPRPRPPAAMGGSHGQAGAKGGDAAFDAASAACFVWQARTGAALHRLDGSALMLGAPTRAIHLEVCEKMEEIYVVREWGHTSVPAALGWGGARPDHTSVRGWPARSALSCWGLRTGHLLSEMLLHGRVRRLLPSGPGLVSAHAKIDAAHVMCQHLLLLEDHPDGTSEDLPVAAGAANVAQPVQGKQEAIPSSEDGAPRNGEEGGALRVLRELRLAGHGVGFAILDRVRDGLGALEEWPLRYQEAAGKGGLEGPWKDFFVPGHAWSSVAEVCTVPDGSAGGAATVVEDIADSLSYNRLHESGASEMDAGHCEYVPMMANAERNLQDLKQGRLGSTEGGKALLARFLPDSYASSRAVSAYRSLAQPLRQRVRMPGVAAQLEDLKGAVVTHLEHGADGRSAQRAHDGAVGTRVAVLQHAVARFTEAACEGLRAALALAPSGAGPEEAELRTAEAEVQRAASAAAEFAITAGERDLGLSGAVLDTLKAAVGVLVFLTRSARARGVDGKAGSNEACRLGGQGAATGYVSPLDRPMKGACAEECAIMRVVRQVEVDTETEDLDMLLMPARGWRTGRWWRGVAGVQASRGRVLTRQEVRTGPGERAPLLRLWEAHSGHEVRGPNAEALMVADLEEISDVSVIVGHDAKVGVEVVLLCRGENRLLQLREVQEEPNLGPRSLSSARGQVLEGWNVKTGIQMWKTKVALGTPMAVAPDKETVFVIGSSDPDASEATAAAAGKGAAAAAGRNNFIHALNIRTGRMQRSHHAPGGAGNVEDATQAAAVAAASATASATSTHATTSPDYSSPFGGGDGSGDGGNGAVAVAETAGRVHYAAPPYGSGAMVSALVASRDASRVYMIGPRFGDAEVCGVATADSTEVCRLRLPDPHSKVASLHSTPDGALLLISGRMGEVLVAEAATGEVCRVLRIAPVHLVARLTLSTIDASAYPHPIPPELSSVVPCSARSDVFSVTCVQEGAGREAQWMVVAGAMDDTVSAWRLATGSLAWQSRRSLLPVRDRADVLIGEEEAPSDAAFALPRVIPPGRQCGVSALTPCSEAGRRVIASAHCTLVRLWCVETGEQLAALDGAHGSQISHLSFAQGGKALVTGSEYGRVCAWNLGGDLHQLNKSPPSSPSLQSKGAAALASAQRVPRAPLQAPPRNWLISQARQHPHQMHHVQDPGQWDAEGWRLAALLKGGRRHRLTHMAVYAGRQLLLVADEPVLQDLNSALRWAVHSPHGFRRAGSTQGDVIADFAAFAERAAPWFTLYGSILTLAVTAIQLFTYAFQPASTPESYETLVETLRDLNKLEHVSISTQALLWLGVLLVAIFWAIILIQEAVEWRKFMHPDSQISSLTFTAFDILCQLYSGVLYFPLLELFASMTDCIHDSEGSGRIVLAADRQVECWTSGRSGHLIAYALPSAAAAAIYVPMVYRFLRETGLVFLKSVVLLANVFLTKYANVTALITLVVGVQLVWLTTFRPAYSNGTANIAHLAVNGGVCYTYLVGALCAVDKYGLELDGRSDSDSSCSQNFVNLPLLVVALMVLIVQLARRRRFRSHFAPPITVDGAPKLNFSKLREMGQELKDLKLLHDFARAGRSPLCPTFKHFREAAGFAPPEFAPVAPATWARWKVEPSESHEGATCGWGLLHQKTAGAAAEERGELCAMSGRDLAEGKYREEQVLAIFGELRPLARDSKGLRLAAQEAQGGPMTAAHTTPIGGGGRVWRREPGLRGPRLPGAAVESGYRWVDDGPMPMKEHAGDPTQGAGIGCDERLLVMLGAQKEGEAEVPSAEALLACCSFLMERSASARARNPGVLANWLVTSAVNEGVSWMRTFTEASWGEKHKARQAALKERVEAARAPLQRKEVVEALDRDQLLDLMGSMIQNLKESCASRAHGRGNAVPAGDPSIPELPGLVPDTKPQIHHSTPDHRRSVRASEVRVEANYHAGEGAILAVLDTLLPDETDMLFGHVAVEDATHLRHERASVMKRGQQGLSNSLPATPASDKRLEAVAIDVASLASHQRSFGPMETRAALLEHMIQRLVQYIGWLGDDMIRRAPQKEASQLLQSLSYDFCISLPALIEVSQSASHFDISEYAELVDKIAESLSRLQQRWGMRQFAQPSTLLTFEAPDQWNEITKKWLRREAMVVGEKSIS
ncbi:hypothetical protein CYMTET_16712 [Cymbomonas tetramitiformis]|uniref:Uncharacterized protein n=1 Tax=Cymbomonas tetramitiformis TaxID=36881 RepID=A0AAE0GBJ4_9CHLO|nr:hypothetical protein CYMTET_16712 [Cymbomonas tetramitiformis]